MQLRLPFLLSRKRLITAALLDGCVFTSLYYGMFYWSFERWPAVSLRIGALLVVWLAGSYVIGRYTFNEYKTRIRFGISVIQQSVSTLVMLLLTLSVVLLHFWLFNRDPVLATFRSFLIPFMGAVAILSPLIQIVLQQIIIGNNQAKVWNFIGASEGFSRLCEELEWTRIPVRVNLADEDCMTSLKGDGLIVQDIDKLPSSLHQKLVRLQYKGIIILPLFAWCEAILQRFPSIFLSDADILRGEFTIPSGSLQSRLKRFGDVFVAIFLLIVTSPLMLIAAILIKLSDGGPVFYSQIRSGVDGEPYKIWKFRSMCNQAETSGAQWVERQDPRITQVGSILRRTRLDELPQLWCVLTGAMSLIGPRPERPEFDQELERQIPHYRLRHRIRPGLSGWAQVNYPYGASVEDSANKLSYDLYYLRNFSFWLDLLILFKTIRLVFNAQGALPQPKVASNSANLSLKE